MAAHLLNVPLEVLLQITSYLTTPQYGYLRRTCKQLEALLFGAFAREFFSKRQFALVKFSLQALLDIANSRLGPSLTHLIIHLERPYATRIATRYTSMTPAPILSGKTAVQANEYQAECIDHLEFIMTGEDVDMLSDAIKLLPNLETVGMRDFHSVTRSRDSTAWNSYGCPTFLERTGRRLEIPVIGRGPEYTSHVFLTILRAIGNAAVSGHGSPDLTRLEVLLHHCHISDQSFKIPDRFDAAISLALGKLTSIFLDSLGGEEPYILVADCGGRADPIIGSGYFLSRFLVKAPALEHLRLNFQSYDRDSTQRLLSWLADALESPNLGTASPLASLAAANALKRLPSHFPPTPKFSNLQHLDIGMATVTERILIDLYQNYKSTLQGISLHKITLEGTNEAKVNYWGRLCNALAKSNLELKMLRLSYVKQRTLGHPIRNCEVTFKGSRNKSVKEWRGSAFSQAIKDVIEDMESVWDKSDSEDDDDSMDDDSSDMM
ncbi:hypothetical protein F5Y14DRAFT_426806 [Nemania sp. NC0429]|nr:hypothetical protein F5Y14DRAFT_426806 [Nemania sp. NC0429]